MYEYIVHLLCCGKILQYMNEKKTDMGKCHVYKKNHYQDNETQMSINQHFPAYI